MKDKPTHEPPADEATTASGVTFDPARLSPAQLDGMACVVCRADFTTGIPSVPVAAVDGSQVFACTSHTEPATEGKSASWPSGEPETVRAAAQSVQSAGDESEPDETDAQDKPGGERPTEVASFHLIPQTTRLVDQSSGVSVDITRDNARGGLIVMSDRVADGQPVIAVSDRDGDEIVVFGVRQAATLATILERLWGPGTDPLAVALARMVQEIGQ